MRYSPQAGRLKVNWTPPPWLTYSYHRLPCPGHVPASLSATPCGGYVVYPLGMAVVVRNMATRATLLLEQHTGHVACLRISPDGTRLASGQESPGETKVRDAQPLLQPCLPHIGGGLLTPCWLSSNNALGGGGDMGPDPGQGPM